MNTEQLETEKFTTDKWAAFRDEAKNQIGVKTRFETLCIVEKPTSISVANILLMAAAPDMYAALKDLLKLHRNDNEDGSPEYGIVSRALQAIKKANPDGKA